MCPPFTADEEHHLPNVLSAPRFATYLRETGNDRTRALHLYHWNLQVSAAFMVPLHVLEVALRNAIVEAIEAVHGGTCLGHKASSVRYRTRAVRHTAPNETSKAAQDSNPL